jgi:outer membrane protein assembly factor BamB
MIISIFISVLFFNLCSNPVSPADEHLQELWAIPLNDIAYSGFIVSNNHLIFKTSSVLYGKLYKVTKDGKILKTASTGGCTQGIPVVQDNIIYHNNCDILYSLREDDLSIIWSKSDFTWIPIPAADENYVYVTDLDAVYALEKTTGNTVWTTQIYGKNAANPVIDGDTLYFATGVDFFKDGYLYSINKITGDINYQVLIPYIQENSQIGGSMAGVTIWRNFILVSSDNWIIYCFSKTSGELVWSYKADAPIEVTSKVSEDKVYFGTLNTTCYALNAYTGEYLWSFRGGGSIQFEPSFYQNYVMFKASGALIILDKNSGKKIVLMDEGKIKYGYEKAYWDNDGKIYAGGYTDSDQKPMLIAFQFK